MSALTDLVRVYEVDIDGCCLQNMYPNAIARDSMIVSLAGVVRHLPPRNVVHDTAITLRIDERPG